MIKDRIMRFTFNLPVNLLFGGGVVEETGKKTAALGKKALVVTGRGSAKKSGLLDRVTGLLGESGVEWIVFDKAEPNPLATQVYEGAELAKKKGCDVVIGLGGGSILDAAKCIAFMVKNEGDLMDYIFLRRPAGDALPLILIPTTCGTGSEGNGFAVITDPRNGDKKSLRSNSIIAKLSIIDPRLMTTMPKGVLASVGFDALCHLMEAWLSAISTPLTDALALEGIRLVNESLVPLYKGSGGDAEWEKLTLASTLGGICIGVAGVVAPHGIEHPPSGLRNITHGKGLAALTPVVFEHSIHGAPEKCACISRLLGGRDEKDCVASIKRLLSAIDLDIGLGEQGILAEDIGWMTENTLRVSAAGIANHPVKFSPEEIKEIYRAAL
jgi:alcohol dehydrogenase class IV